VPPEGDGSDRESLAVKRFEDSASGADSFKRELAAAERVVHKHVLPVMGKVRSLPRMGVVTLGPRARQPAHPPEHTQCEELRCLVLPRMRGSVAQLGSTLDAMERVDTMKAVASALCALHAEGLVHRDVKASNVLLHPDGGVRLADCGLTQTACAAIGATAGEAGYVDPAVFVHHTEALSTAVDLYGLGIFIAEQLSGASASKRETLGPDFRKARTPRVRAAPRSASASATASSQSSGATRRSSTSWPR
jgi:serine/threonine protein kinase